MGLIRAIDLLGKGVEAGQLWFVGWFLPHGIEIALSLNSFSQFSFFLFLWWGYVLGQAGKKDEPPDLIPLLIVEGY